MNTPHISSASASIGLALLLIPVSLLGQAVPGANPVKPSTDDVIELSPFVIKPDSGWVGSSSLVGTRTNAAISNIPLSVDAITADFLQDLSAFTLEEAAQFVSNVTTTDLTEGRSRDEGRVAYRGIESSSATAGGSTAQSSRNFFVWYSPTDNYNIERIDFNKGSNSLMFGDASPGGQAATYTKRAQFRNFGQVTSLYGSFGSYRLMLDANRRLNEKLAVRVNYVARSEGSYLDDVASKLRAAHLAVTYQPFKNTQIRAEFERGKFDRTRGDNRILVRQQSSPGLGFDRANRWYVTSDNSIVNRTNTLTTLFPPLQARDITGASGLLRSSLEGKSLDIPLFTTSGPTSGTAIPTGRSVAFAGRSRTTSLFPSDRLERPYNNGSLWMLQNWGKLDVELAYNQQQTQQVRDDSTPTPVSMDATGRFFVERSFSIKDYTSRVQILRATASYPFDLGRLGSQFVVLTTSAMKDRSFRWRYILANFGPVDSGAPNVNIRNHQIVVRAYLDDPNFGSEGFWSQLQPGNLPTRSGFRSDWFSDTSTVNPFYEIGYSKSYSLSSAGKYLGGRLHSIAGVRYDSFDRKVITDLPRDAIGQSVFLGYPEQAPRAYSFDSRSDLSNTTYSGGLSYELGRAVSLYASYGTSYRWQSAELFTGENPGPVLGETREIGLKGTLLGGRLFATVAAYRIQRDNAVFVWADGPPQLELENLFNPNNIAPGDPAYFALPTGLNNEWRTTSASEQSEGVEATFQFKRVGGVQARFTVSYNDVTAARDFSIFRSKLEAAELRTRQALAPAGNPALAENASDILFARQVLEANDGVAAITGNRSAEWTASWLFDYEFASGTTLKGTRLAVYGSWRGDYNLNLLSGVTYRGGARHSVGAYALHRRKIFERPVSFRLGLKNLIDLETPSKDYRLANVIGVNPDGSTIRQYRYVDPLSVDFTVTLDF